MLREIKENNLTFEKKVSVIDFNATWCMPCKMLKPVIDEISEELTEIEFISADVDENTKLAMEYKITNIPALIIVKDGKVQERIVGFIPKDVLVDSFKKYL